MHSIVAAAMTKPQGSGGGAAALASRKPSRAAAPAPRYGAHAGCLPACMDPTLDVLLLRLPASAMPSPSPNRPHPVPPGVDGAVVVWAWRYNPDALPAEELLGFGRWLRAHAPLFEELEEQRQRLLAPPPPPAPPATPAPPQPSTTGTPARGVMDYLFTRPAAAPVLPAGGAVAGSPSVPHLAAASGEGGGAAAAAAPPPSLPLTTMGSAGSLAGGGSGSLWPRRSATQGQAGAWCPPFPSVCTR